VVSNEQHGDDAQRGDAGEKAGLFQNHGWLIPATVIGAIIAAFVAMIVLTWVAGGSTPFGG
jgi:hypothetical protein